MLAFPAISMILDAMTQDLDEKHPFEKLRGKVSAQQQKLNNDKLQFADPAIKNGKYNLSLDFSKFKPEEVEIKLGADKMLRIDGKHEHMSEDGSSYVYQQYTHHFSIPDNVEHEQLKSKLDNYGILRIEAPVKIEKNEEDDSRSIPIEYVSRH